MSAAGLFDLSGKVALVTGAARGLGAAMALALADAGADVAVHAGETSPAATESAIAAKAGGRRVSPPISRSATTPHVSCRPSSKHSGGWIFS